MGKLFKVFFNTLLVVAILATIWIIVVYIPTVTASGDVVPVMEMSGFDVAAYYFYLFQNYFADYSWQVKTSYFIVFAAIVTMIILFFLFTKDVLARKAEEKRQNKIEDKYMDAFREILGNDILSNEEMIRILDANEIELRKNNPSLFVKLLAKVRMEMYEVVYLPNLQPLADLTGVREHMEANLLKGEDVFHTLQIMLLFQLVISEGRLANYINANDKEIRMLARLSYILCSDTEPYRYLEDDLEERQSLMRPMILHYIFGWMKEKMKRMPNFLLMSDRIKNEDMSAFLIREVAYWGGQDEKEGIRELFLSPKIPCRSAAINVVAMINDKNAEEEMIKTYDYQPENIRRDILNAVLAIRSGKQLEFLTNCFRTSAARLTRELALSCIYNYGNEGRRRFEDIRATASPSDKILIDQIDTSNVLTMIRSYN